MKIGIIKRRYVAEGGGSERYTNGLIRELQRLGHEIHVFAQQADGGSVAIHRVPVRPGPSFVHQLSFASNCRRAIQASSCDLTFSLERTVLQDIARAGGGCHREYLAQCRHFFSPIERLRLGLNPLHRALLSLEKRTFCPDNTRVVIANSNRGKEEIVRHYGFPAERIDVIHNGTDCERFRPPPRDEDGNIVLLFVGSGFERKGLGFAIRALGRLPGNVELRIAGKGNYRKYLAIARKLGVESRAHFLGVQSKIEEVYAQGDILVHPAIYEPFSNACLEAMACGLPVVTSRMNGASEVIHPGRNGAVVEDPSDVESLAAAIELFINRKQLREARIEARKTAEGLPMTLNVRRTIEVTQKILDSGGQRSTVA